MASPETDKAGASVRHKRRLHSLPVGVPPTLSGVKPKVQLIILGRSPHPPGHYDTIFPSFSMTCFSQSRGQSLVVAEGSPAPYPQMKRRKCRRGSRLASREWHVSEIPRNTPATNGEHHERFIRLPYGRSRTSSKIPCCLLRQRPESP